ncbi:TetR/AcrR family transcriptional regulator [Williamsia deligens]|uniref:TetR/AcrR family transcriptional regulator n=1 Tax=Williamsia deligens TaxID=321325 RepID=A0ABW3G6G6_9NOCA|nr:TetR/AcrR family transcriptional regulator [Williamsia deligens]
MGPTGRRRGRGAREQILGAARRLFESDGMTRSGMDAVAREAGVSKRTVYQHFPTKGDLLVAYLATRDLDQEPWDLDPSLGPREQILAVFTAEPETPGGLTPMCPFVRAAVEISDDGHPARDVVRRYKVGVADRFRELARAAGAEDPGALGEQLALLLDGAAARTRALGDESIPTAAAIARTLLDAAIPENAGARS